MKKIWIVAAHEKEIPGIRAFIGEHNKKPHDLEFHTVGIGLFESFYNFSVLLSSNKPPEIILLAGTAGSHDADHIFKMSLSNKFLNPQFDHEDLPEFLPKSWETLPVDFLKIPKDNLHVPVYSSFGISTTSNHLNASMRGSWENMESLSLSYNCMKRQIPFMALLCCTNQICIQGRQQWRENFERAGAILLENLKYILS